MASAAPITTPPHGAPLDIVSNVQVWLSQAEAILRLWIDANSEGTRPWMQGDAAIETVENLLQRSGNDLAAVEVALRGFTR